MNAVWGLSHALTIVYTNYNCADLILQLKLISFLIYRRQHQNRANTKSRWLRWERGVILAFRRSRKKSTWYIFNCPTFSCSLAAIYYMCPDYHWQSELVCFFFFYAYHRSIGRHTATPESLCLRTSLVIMTWSSSGKPRLVHLKIW